jgi:hypothetical protein
LVRASFWTAAPGPLLDGRFRSSLRGGTNSRQVFAGRPQASVGDRLGIRGLQRRQGVDARLRGRHLANSRSYPTLTGCSKSYSSAEPTEVSCTSGPNLGRRIPNNSRASCVLSGVRRASRILASSDPRLFGTVRTGRVFLIRVRRTDPGRPLGLPVDRFRRHGLAGITFFETRDVSRETVRAPLQPRPAT